MFQRDPRVTTADDQL